MNEVECVAEFNKRCAIQYLSSLPGVYTETPINNSKGKSDFKNIVCQRIVCQGEQGFPIIVKKESEGIVNVDVSLELLARSSLNYSVIEEELEKFSTENFRIRLSNLNHPPRLSIHALCTSEEHLNRIYRAGISIRAFYRHC